MPPAARPAPVPEVRTTPRDDGPTPPPPPRPATPPTPPNRSSRRAPLLAAAGVAAATGVVALADPQGNHVPLCPLLATTGLDCPMCGGLRSVQSLTRGDVVGAADHNLLFVASLPILAVLWLWWFRGSGSNGPTRGTVPTWLVPASLGIALAFAVLRNIPALGWLDSR